MAAFRSFKIICGPLQLLPLLLLQDLVEPSQPQIRGPQGRIMAGSRASFQCSASESSKDIQVNWIKDGERIQPNQAKISPTEFKGERMYLVTSSVEILLGQGDVKSQLSCQIHHNSSQKFSESFRLGDVLRDSQEQSFIFLCIALFLSRVAILLFISCLFLRKVFGRKRTKSRSGTSQETRQSGTSS